MRKPPPNGSDPEAALTPPTGAASVPAPTPEALSRSREAFRATVCQRFGRNAAHYDSQAHLQQAIAWRLAHLCRDLPLPPGARADLGAGSGLLSRALVWHHPQLREMPPLQVDQCAELLAHNPLTHQGAATRAEALVWDLHRGLPPPLGQASLLASSFALQWLERPPRQLAFWCQGLGPGGWLVLAVPTAASFPQWRRAAERAAVPCTALALPDADTLRATALREGLRERLCQTLHFSRPHQGGLEALRHLQRLGASASRHRPLSAGELRRLLRQWPSDSPLTWQVLLLVAQRPGP